MNVLKIYALDINEFGELTKRLMAKVSEDGQVGGDSFFAVFLAGAVNKTMLYFERGERINLEFLQNLYTNGYYAAEIVKEEEEVA